MRRVQRRRRRRRVRPDHTRVDELVAPRHPLRGGVHRHHRALPARRHRVRLPRARRRHPPGELLGQGDAGGASGAVVPVLVGASPRALRQQGHGDGGGGPRAGVDVRPAPRAAGRAGEREDDGCGHGERRAVGAQPGGADAGAHGHARAHRGHVRAGEAHRGWQRRDRAQDLLRSVQQEVPSRRRVAPSAKLDLPGGRPDRYLRPVLPARIPEVPPAGLHVRRRGGAVGGRDRALHPGGGRQLAPEL